MTTEEYLVNAIWLHTLSCEKSVLALFNYWLNPNEIPDPHCMAPMAHV